VGKCEVIFMFFFSRIKNNVADNTTNVQSGLSVFQHLLEIN
jgi:hypothetical protein